MRDWCDQKHDFSQLKIKWNFLTILSVNWTVSEDFNVMADDIKKLANILGVPIPIEWLLCTFINFLYMQWVCNAYQAGFDNPLPFPVQTVWQFCEDKEALLRSWRQEADFPSGVLHIASLPLSAHVWAAFKRGGELGAMHGHMWYIAIHFNNIFFKEYGNIGSPVWRNVTPAGWMGHIFWFLKRPLSCIHEI